MLTRWLACVGLANLFLLAEWQHVDVVYRPDVSYFVEGRFPFTYAWSMLLVVGVLGTALALFSILLSRLRLLVGDRAGGRLTAGVTAVCVIVTWLGATPLLLSSGGRALGAACLTGVGVALVAHPPPAVALKVFARLLAGTAVLLPVLALTALARHLTAPQPPRRTVGHGGAVAVPATRVLWVIFDELDSAVAVDQRPPGLRLPAFDRLRSESFEATQAYSPGRWTLDALPTLWTGRPVSEARESGPHHLRLTFADSSEPHAFDPSTSVFARAHGAGFTVGIAGWYHPYCRLFDTIADPCLAVVSGDAFHALRRALVTTAGGAKAAVPQLIAWHAPWSLEAIVTGGSPQARVEAEEAYIRAWRALTYTRIHERSLQMARDPQRSLVFVHYPVPHMPGFFESERGAIDTSGRRGYEDNLALMDRALGELRRALEDAGLWSTTTLLVHSDHALRPQLWKRLGIWTPALEQATGGRTAHITPFVVKMAGSSAEHLEYHQAFNSALAHDAVLALLEGRVRSSADLAAWLDRHRGRIPLTWPVTTIADR